MILAVLAVSCEKDEDPVESCDGEDVSGEYNCPIDVDVIATFCADGVTNSYYTYNGEDYACTGVDVSTCDGAIDAISDALIEAGCATKKKSGSMESSKIKLTQLAENLLAEVRAESLYK